MYMYLLLGVKSASLAAKIPQQSTHMAESKDPAQGAQQFHYGNHQVTPTNPVTLKVS